MSIRAEIADALRADAAITVFVADRIQEHFYEYEQMRAAAADAKKFPAIGISDSGYEEDTDFEGNAVATRQHLSLQLLQLADVAKRRSPHAATRTAARAKERVLDDLRAAIIPTLRGINTNTQTHIWRVTIDSIDTVDLDVSKDIKIIQQTISIQVFT